MHARATRFRSLHTSGSNTTSQPRPIDPPARPNSNPPSSRLLRPSTSYQPSLPPSRVGHATIPLTPTLLCNHHIFCIITITTPHPQHRLASTPFRHKSPDWKIRPGLRSLPAIDQSAPSQPTTHLFTIYCVLISIIYSHSYDAQATKTRTRISLLVRSGQVTQIKRLVFHAQTPFRSQKCMYATQNYWVYLFFTPKISLFFSD